MQNKQYNKSVAVITSTIGRPELRQAIQSVEAQTYPCTHYIFVDGKQHKDAAEIILKEYPNTVVTYLPMNTGADGWTNSSINAIAPFLVKEDIICYLDDDNWYAPNHIENCVATLEKTDADLVYSLRNLYTLDKEFLCEDFIESIGFYENKLSYPRTINFNFDNEDYSITHTLNRTLIDTNCYAMKRNIAAKLAQYWCEDKLNDYTVFNKIKELGLVCACTNTFSVNYIFDAIKQIGTSISYLYQLGLSDQNAIELVNAIRKQENKLNLELYGGNYPWQK
ncbi:MULTISPECIES: glycosyltransferase family A protein [Glaesserella]|uniref:Glycosyltransferase n=1 Tax=Glaesserella australis TaxID=2094024 RepID=A0A328BYR9_9PAST|nr:MULTISPECIES: glycosyltransferase family A protein [Glaesserella]AUI66360.1 glycosyltransferase [Glaesserella sp. 15-184]RAL19426.1 glycosyltransferase [Glaesserella australis]